MVNEGYYKLLWKEGEDRTPAFLKYLGNNMCTIIEFYKDGQCSIKYSDINCDDAFDYMYMWSDKKGDFSYAYDYTVIKEDEFNNQLDIAYKRIKNG